MLQPDEKGKLLAVHRRHQRLGAEIIERQKRVVRDCHKRVEEETKERHKRQVAVINRMGETFAEIVMRKQEVGKEKMHFGGFGIGQGNGSCIENEKKTDTHKSSKEGGSCLDFQLRQAIGWLFRPWRTYGMLVHVWCVEEGCKTS